MVDSSAYKHLGRDILKAAIVIGLGVAAVAFVIGRLFGG